FQAEDGIRDFHVTGVQTWLFRSAISLIVRRSFTPASTQEFGREVNSTLLSAGTEIAFNQLNSIISQSLNVNFFDLNIRSFNDARSEERRVGKEGRCRLWPAT